MSKLAILQMSDTPQIESSAQMLRYAGYKVKVCGSALRNQLKSYGCDTVTAVQQMIQIGYDTLDPTIEEASPQDFENCDLYCDVKYRNLQKIWERHPTHKKRSCWWRVNGARPEASPDGGEEINTECPVITANLWYGTEEYNPHKKNYVFWPPYPRSADYDPDRRKDLRNYAEPYCLCHGIAGWGYDEIVGECRTRFNVKIYGIATPNGIVPHRRVAELAATSIAMLHLKSVDCPGWAIYEAMLAGCPIIVSRLLINRMLGHELFVEGETCLAFGLPGDETGRGDMGFEKCPIEIAEHLNALRDPNTNRRIGLAGREKLLQLMWREDRDGPGFVRHLQTVYS